MFDCEFIEKQTTDSISMHDSRFLKIMKEGLSIENGHIELPLPFKEDDIYFPDNKLIALKRLYGLKKRLLKNCEFRNDYKKSMCELMEKGYAEKVNSSPDQEGHIWYIPHHGVYHPRKPEKL